MIEHQEKRSQSACGVSVVSRGSGDPVLLLHGIGGSATTFADLAEILAGAGYWTCAWDAPGYGHSVDRPDEGVDHVAAALAVLMDMAEGPVHVVGTSWGGTIAIEMALRRPDLFRSVVAVDSTRGSAVTPQRRAAMLGRLADLEREGSAAFADQRASRIVSDTCAPEVRKAVHRAMAQVRTPGYRAAAHMMAATDLGPRLHSVTTPTLVLVGEHDEVTGVAESRLLADAIPEARFGLIPGAGHSAVVEKPEVCAEHMRRFWARCRSLMV